FNPLMKTLRGLQQTTELDDVKKKLKIKRCSLGALSEAGYVFDAKLLEPLFRELIKRTLEKEGKLTGIEKQLVAVDGTIIQSVSKAFWVRR
ncbi:MAG: hypothetical protein HQL01_03810, partial [Nitrospirae bacterium]|nr:hypothetical protein [Nitrospirota bacterium]